MSTSQKTVIQLKATPEVEDFNHKYTDEGNNKLYGMLLDNYFRHVARMTDRSQVTSLKRAKAIEIGCGEGFSTQRLSAMLSKNVKLEASEYVAHMIPAAKTLNPGMKITEESIYELKHKANEFDLVFLLEVLEHLDFPDGGLQELQRITKPGGYLVLGVPHEPLWCALNMVRGKYLARFGNTPGHLNHWSAFGVKRYVEKYFGPVVSIKTPLPWTILLAQKR